MEHFKKTKNIEIDVYKTSDGKEWTSEKEAQLHEDKTKTCTICSGKGKINERYEKEWVNTSWVPMEGEWKDVLKSDKCQECNGR